MAIVCNSLAELKVYIQAQINGTLRTDVKDEVVEMIGAMGLNNVYGAYSPTMYKRRYGEGTSLLDPENYDGEVADGVLTIKSTASPNYSYNGAYDYTVKSLAELVERGQQGGQLYSFPVPENVKGPRPFIEPTREKLSQGDMLKSIMKKGLKRRGLTVE